MAVNIACTWATDSDVGELTAGYGLVVADECHHVPAAAFTDAVRQIPARRWLGLTATPYRRDKLDDLIYWQTGEVMHTITLPRGPDTVSPELALPGITLPGAAARPVLVLQVHHTAYCYSGEASPQAPGGMAAIYRDLAAYDRARQVTADVAAALDRGRNCLVLTQWVAHLDRLAQALRAMDYDPVALRGGMGARNRAAALGRLQPQPGGPPLLVVATGPYARGRLRLPGPGHPVPRRPGPVERTPAPVRRADPAPLPPQGHRRGPRLPRCPHRSPRGDAGGPRTWLHQPRLP